MGITDKTNDMQKIMFNSYFGLEQAVLEGRKTMTRRSVSDKILNKYQDYLNWWNTQKGGFKVPEDEFYRCESPLKVNDVIAIAQSYKDVTEGRTWAVSNAYGHSVHKDVLKQSAGWDNKMFVKADLMKHHIKITDIKVERLQACSDDDCLREGIDRFEKEWGCWDKEGCSFYTFSFDSSREAFAALIDKISGKGTWESNPWCFCYEFKLID